ncbi:MAG: hypothetical protein J2P24_03080 [Streptosporangiales bacterium]|nr:hypothetical protein [Streptosporangiales bacterium]
MKRRLGSAIAGAVAALLTVGLAACSHDDPGSRYGSVSPLPPHSATPTPTPTPTGTQGMSDQAQVKALYLDFIVHYTKAQDMPKSKRRTYLSRWLIEPGLTRYEQGIQEQLDKHERFEGAFESRVFSVKVSGSSATIDDCAGQSRTLLRSTKTGKVIIHGPKRRAWITAKMKHTEAGWRIYYTNSPSRSCAGRS